VGSSRRPVTRGTEHSLISNNRYHESILEAEELLRTALSTSNLSWKHCEEIYESERLKKDLDPKINMLELQVWQLGGADDQQAKAAHAFFDAGRRFSLAMEFSQVPAGSIDERISRGTEAFNKALVCLHVALRLAKKSGAPEFRQLEIDTAHAVAYAYLTWSEIFGALMRRVREDDLSVASRTAFSIETIGGGTTEDEFTRTAGAYYELAGRFDLKGGRKEEAADAFSAAAHQYAKVSHGASAARVSEEESQLRRKLGDLSGAARALEKQAAYLTDKATAEQRTHFAWDSAAADMRAGRLLAEDALRKVEAAGLIMKGAKLAASQPLNERGVTVYLEGSSASADTLILDSLRLAEDLYEEAGRFQDADFAHRLRRQYARTLYKRYSPVFLFSLLLDAVWGYGTKPGRLLATCLAVIAGFAVAYAALIPAHPVHGLPSDRFRVLMATAWDAVVTSVEAFALGWLVKWREVLGISLDVPTIRSIRYLSWLEAGLGFALLTMAAFVVIRWFRRNFIPH
jgi:hypothetical protein